MAPPRQPVSAEAQRAIDLIITRWHAVTDMRALADITVDRGGERQQLTGVLLAKAPGSVRFEALSPFGQPMVVAVVHDSQMTAFSAMTNEAVVGAATAETTAHLFGVPLEPHDLVAIVTGHAVPPADIRVAEILPPDGLGPSISLTGKVSEQRVWMDFKTGVVQQLQIIGGRAAAIATVLTILDFPLSTRTEMVWFAVANRVLTLVGIWVTAWLVISYATAGRALNKSLKDLADTNFALNQAAIVAVTDVKGRIQVANDKFCEISKYSRDELLGQDHRIINSGYHPKEFIHDLWQTIGQGRIWRGELRNRAKDGSIYWVDTTIVPFLDDRGKPYQYMAIRYDITERKKSEARLREQTALARLGEMAAVVAHEVKNPLAGIRGALQVIPGKKIGGRHGTRLL